jgi:hypothetical protein
MNSLPKNGKKRFCLWIFAVVDDLLVALFVYLVQICKNRFCLSIFAVVPESSRRQKIVYMISKDDGGGGCWWHLMSRTARVCHLSLQQQMICSCMAYLPTS